MDQLQINQQLLAIWQLLQQNFEYGASIEEISAALPFEMERRTLQRRLEMLQAQGAVNVSGKTKATRYLASAVSYRPRPKIACTAVKVELSGPATLAMQSVSQPLDKRNRVNVNGFFLESYRPNIDNYLTDAERKRLHEMGKTKFTGYAAGTYAKGVMHALVADLSWNSCRLEGNVYSHPETEALFTRGELAEHASDIEHQMVLNHKDAVEFMVNRAEDVRFDSYTLLNLHAILSNNLMLDASRSGKLRTLPVAIAGSTFVPASQARQIEERFHLILEKASQISDPFEQAFFMLVQLPYLQAFSDMNLPVARMAANISLTRNNLMPLSFQDLPAEMYEKALLSVFELNRVDLLKDLFMFTYERSCNRYAQVKHTFGEPDPFRIRYREQVRTVVFDIVSGNMLPDAAGEAITAEASTMPALDQLRFHELVQKELATLHEGNIARYWIRPSEFIVWRATWDTGIADMPSASRVVRMNRFLTAATV